MDNSTIQILSILVLLLTLGITALFSRRRRSRFPIRSIAAFEQIPGLVGNAIEADRPLHLSFGSTSLGGANTLLSLANAELVYYVTRKAAIGDLSPIVTVSNASVLPLAQDALRRAYYSRNLGERYRASGARWYPAGSRSLAFAAALSAMMGDEQVSANIMAGNYGPELALIADTSQRRHLPFIATSAQLTGQAVAFAMGSAPLIGEEVFAAPAYLDDDDRTTQPITIDALRWILVITLLLGLLAKLAEGG